MPAIWKQNPVQLQQLNLLCQNTMAELLNIRFIAFGDNFLKASMPVNHRTHQPIGLLHGGASAALAETVGSVASWLCIDVETHICVGMEINCNHIRGKRTGTVVATASPLHLGGTSHVWDIKIRDEKEQLVCVSRLTVAILKKKE
jgi:1,4-dihydroxy-2-naphthoyl-CoA hydrolase